MGGAGSECQTQSGGVSWPSAPRSVALITEPSSGLMEVVFVLITQSTNWLWFELQLIGDHDGRKSLGSWAGLWLRCKINNALD